MSFFINSNLAKAFEETHLFILWENALKSEYSNQILEDIKENFTILDIYKISWTPEKFANNLERLSKAPFYQDPKFFTEEFINKRIQANGIGPFLCIVVDVENPVFEKKKTKGNGIRKVCINIFNKKYYYRDLVKDFTVHATDDREELNRNLILLLGKSVDDFKKEYTAKWDGVIKNREEDLIGADTWKSTDEILYVLSSSYQEVYSTKNKNITNIYFSTSYPNEVEDCIKCILNLETTSESKNKNQFKIKIENKMVSCSLEKIKTEKFVFIIDNF